MDIIEGRRRGYYLLGKAGGLDGMEWGWVGILEILGFFMGFIGWGYWFGNFRIGVMFG